MLKRWPVRYQIRLGTIVLLVMVVVLTSVSFWGVLKFHSLAKSIRQRTYELPLAASLSREVWKLKELNEELLDNGSPKGIFGGQRTQDGDKNKIQDREDFYHQLGIVYDAYDAYCDQLNRDAVPDDRIADISDELAATAEIEKYLKRLGPKSLNVDWIMNSQDVAMVHTPLLNDLQVKVDLLPVLFQQRMEKFAVAARSDYRSMYFYNVAALTICLTVICSLFVAATRKIFRPLESMIRGSRRIAEGDYDYRINLKTDGEMAVLARALNQMTANFQAIRNDLDRQVYERTKEVIRSEQMASVGFLAAGLAHEINNPLAAIAWSAESLESRFIDLQEMDSSDDIDIQQRDKDIEVICKYLRRIQDEAFRCKNITSGLLDYSRLDDKKKHAVELVELIQSVIDMVVPLQKYSNRNIHFHPQGEIYGLVNAQEMKQVVLNLLTNALESIPRDGNVWVDLNPQDNKVQLTIRDDGFGMTPEVREHLFEPFFTRRQDGSGTGLGLSITYRIIEEHQGSIVAHSEGENKGATFTVQLPLVSNEQKEVKRVAA